MRSLGLLPMANSIGVLPLRVTCVFLTVAALRINGAGVNCDRVVLSKLLEAVSTSAERNFLKKPDTHVNSIWPRSVWPGRTCFHIVHSIDCLHVMKVME